MHQTPSPIHRVGFRMTPLAAAPIAALAFSASADAFEIDTGNPDCVLRWDNTARHNLGVRTQKPKAQITANPNYDDGDRNFDRNSIVANQLDILSEAGFVVNKKFGARLSAAGWADAAYGSLDDTNNASANALVNGVRAAGALSPSSSRPTWGSC